MNKLKIVVFVWMLPVAREAEAQLGPPPATGQLPKTRLVPLSGRSQNGTVVPSETVAPGGKANSVQVSLARAVGQTAQGIASLVGGR